MSDAHVAAVHAVFLWQGFSDAIVRQGDAYTTLSDSFGGQIGIVERLAEFALMIDPIEAEVRAEYPEDPEYTDPWAYELVEPLGAKLFELMHEHRRKLTDEMFREAAKEAMRAYFGDADMSELPVPRMELRPMVEHCDPGENMEVMPIWTARDRWPDTDFKPMWSIYQVGVDGLSQWVADFEDWAKACTALGALGAHQPRSIINERGMLDELRIG